MGNPFSIIREGLANNPSSTSLKLEKRGEIILLVRLVKDVPSYRNTPK
jgi:hypothetical protein